MKNSIIICAYNEEKTVENVVTSCCKFNPNAEIIVVDDGSVDNTGKILKNLSKNYNFKYEKLKKNKGKSRAMVRWVEISTGEIITFFDADVSNIKKEHLSPLQTGIRAKLEGYNDFVIEYSKENNNMINLIGIDSPGLTSSLAIAQYVEKMIR